MWITTLKWTSRLEALAGGVFLGAGLAHLLADSFEDVGELTKYPASPAIALVTFVILTAVELFSYGEHDEEFQVGDDHGHSHGHNHSAQFDSIPDNQTALLEKDEHQAVNNTSNVQLFGTKKCSFTIPTTSLYIIMDVHSAIEGLALGIMTTWSGVIAIFCAIVGHKPVEAFALSLILLKDKPTKGLFWFCVVLYSIMSPIGLIVGIFVVEFTENKWVMGSIAAFSAGTFLFVGCHEWSELFEHKSEWSCSEKSWHYGMFVLGVAWMLLIAIVEALNPEDD
jgi:zinc transporter 1/2/3